VAPLGSCYFWFLDAFDKVELSSQRACLAGLLLDSEGSHTRQGMTKKTLEKKRAKEASSAAAADQVQVQDGGNDKSVRGEGGEGVATNRVGILKNDSWAAGSKNRRKTLRKQLSRIDAALAKLEKGESGEQPPSRSSSSVDKATSGGSNTDNCGGRGGARVPVPRRCRWCEQVLTEEWQVSLQKKVATAAAAAISVALDLPPAVSTRGLDASFTASDNTGDERKRGVCNGRCWGFWKAAV